MQKKIEYLKTLPKKRIAVGVLLFNDDNQLLVLKPSYKDHWTIPGGVVNEYESLIDNDEIIESKFVHFEEALKILSANTSKRLNRLNGNFEKFVFMENGIPII